MAPPTQNPPSQDPSRHSVSTYRPNYMGSDMFDLNQYPKRLTHMGLRTFTGKFILNP